MLRYLVVSRARRGLLRLLWVDRVVAPVSELARRAEVSFSTAQRELAAMERAGLALSSADGNRVEYRANVGSSHGELLARLLADETPAPSGDGDEDAQVRAWLKAHGAPLAGPGARATSRPAVEDVLTPALRLAHRDAAVARALPVLLWRQHEHLDWERVFGDARTAREDQALGFFLDLTAELADSRELATLARSLRDRRRKKTRPFFVGSQGAHALALARKNTPRVAKRWGFTMNMPLESFVALFEKFAT